MRSYRVPEYTLIDIYSALRLDDCVRRGTLYEDAIQQQVSGAHLCSDPAATSYYRRIRTHSGSDIARIHYVMCPIAGIIGRWISTVKVGDITFHRVGHQMRP